MELEQIQIDTIMERLPDFELSYETVSHKKVYNYDIAMAIPFGKKCLCWFSYFNDEDVCYFMNLNKEKNVSDQMYFLILFHTIMLSFHFVSLI